MCHDRTRVRAVRCIRSAGAPRNLPRKGKQGNHTSYYLLVLGVTSGTAARKIYDLEDPNSAPKRPSISTLGDLHVPPPTIYNSPNTARQISMYDELFFRSHLRPLLLGRAPRARQRSLRPLLIRPHAGLRHPPCAFHSCSRRRPSSRGESRERGIPSKATAISSRPLEATSTRGRTCSPCGRPGWCHGLPKPWWPC